MSEFASHDAPQAALRAEVRGFLNQARSAGMFEPRCDAWMTGFSSEFSRELGRRGYIGMTWPARYGGGERSAVDRFVVSEELLAAGAPVAAHWFADRQSGPQIYRHGSEALREQVLPRIAAGECFFAIGMSEPDSGSDLASIRTRARRTAGGWQISGRKVWTSHAHRSHYLSVLCRTSDEADRHDGLSVIIVDLKAPGVSARPIRSLSGELEFNEVVLDEVRVPDEMLVGEAGDGWRLVTGELSLERSGPERFMSTYPLLAELIATLGKNTDPAAAEQIGALLAELRTLGRMSMGVASALERGHDPAVEAAIVKDRGTQFERRVIEVARTLMGGPLSRGSGSTLQRMLADAVLAAPGFTLRGGTSEVLRTIVARALLAR